MIGVSFDSVADQKKFAEDEGFPYQLLSDPDGSAASKYGVLSPDGAYARRITFVIDAKGVLRHVDQKVDVRKHGDDLFELIEGLE